MKTYALPATIGGLIFDIDLTLYDSRDYYDSLEHLLVQRLAVHRDEPVEVTRRVVAQTRQTFANENQGRSLSLGNTFLKLGIDIQTSVIWRAELFQPEQYLQPDPRLKATLAVLSQRFKIGAVTNNAHAIALRTLEALGVRAFFSPVIGLDQSGVSKPTMVPFQMTAEAWDLPLTEMVSIGDRFSVDLEQPLAHGMGGILVSAMEDVYALPGQF